MPASVSLGLALTPPACATQYEMLRETIEGTFPSEGHAT